MKKIERLKLSDIVKDPLEIEAMSKLHGGFDIMPMAYGCTNDICSSRVNPEYCGGVSANICKESVCSSGVGPSV